VEALVRERERERERERDIYIDRRRLKTWYCLMCVICRE
jgi:hypothetical protein